MADARSTPTSERSAEVRATYERYVEARNQVEAGARSWSAIAEEFFTEDVVFVDPAWGRTEGRSAVAEFMDRSMVGLESWTFPEEWTVADDDRVVSLWWNRLPGTTEDGRPHQAPGISILRYAGNGRFDYELDILNMQEIGEIIAASGWRPPESGMNPPPRTPDRNPSPPRR